MLQQWDERNRDLVVGIDDRLVHRDQAGVSPFDSVVQGGDAVVVLRVRIEPAREHGLEHCGVAALGRPMEHQMVIVSELVPERGPDREHGVGGGAIGAGAARDEALERRELVLGAMREQPGGDRVVAVQLRHRVRRAPVSPALQEIGAVLHQRLDERHVPTPRRHVKRRFL